jgi:hypothetical protein
MRPRGEQQVKNGLFYQTGYLANLATSRGDLARLLARLDGGKLVVGGRGGCLSVLVAVGGRVSN